MVIWPCNQSTCLACVSAAFAADRRYWLGGNPNDFPPTVVCDRHLTTRYSCWMLLDLIVGFLGKTVMHKLRGFALAPHRRTLHYLRLMDWSLVGIFETVFQRVTRGPPIALLKQKGQIAHGRRNTLLGNQSRATIAALAN